MKKLLDGKLGHLKNRNLIALVVIVVLAVIVAIIVASTGQDDDKPVANAAKTKGVACKVMQFNDAYVLMGATTKQDPVKASTASTSDVSVSTCTYRQDGAAANNQKLAATLEVKTPLTSDGKASNKQAFKGKTLSGLKDSPYGEAAFWDAKSGKLNVLKKDTWYVISYGPLSPTARDLSQTEELADTVVPKFN